MSAPLLFKIASAINAISIPGHLVMGLNKVYPSLRLLGDEKHAGALAGARNSWDNVHVLLLVNAILNYQWSQIGGPRTQGEKIIVLAMFLAGLPSSFRYFKAKEYGGVGPMLIAPASTLIGMLMSN
ncbi:hypothetical protein FKW77_005594 [Venturia effusa]|uniref:Ergosterol biosynthesis protein n=1 Tax=Venturia effusa TaxID=50376 RepID=A0A517LRB9_9PEZI|nr:hypothetical protein FKW77_005594 [Venturia effusa]